MIFWEARSLEPQLRAIHIYFLFTFNPIEIPSSDHFQELIRMISITREIPFFERLQSQ